MIKEEFHLAITEKRPYRYVFRAIKPNGEMVYIQGTGSPIYDEDGNFDKIIGTNIDVTKIMSNITTSHLDQKSK